MNGDLRANSRNIRLWTDDSLNQKCAWMAKFVIFFLAQMECAPDGGQIAGWELTGATGLSEDESHGQAPHPQHRIQTAD
ncbi:MAG: hypothetical protein ABSG18_20410, partial [Steroidobacteraceae bacterium]